MFHFTIRTLLCVLFCILALMFSFSSLMAIRGMHDLNAQTEYIATNKLPKAELGKSVEAAFKTSRLSNMVLLLVDDPDDRAKAVRSISDADARLDVVLTQLKPLFVTDSGKSLMDTLVSAVRFYQLKAAEFRRHLATPEGDSGFYKQEVMPAGVEVDKALTALLTYNDQTVTDAVRNSRAIFTETLTTTYVIAALIAIAIVAAIAFTVYGITNPIRTLTKTMNALADGDTRTSAPHGGRTDEIGEMAVAVEVFRRNAQERDRLAQENQDQRDQAEQQARLRLDADRRNATEMTEATNAVARGLRALANGDLTHRLEAPFVTAFEGLRADFNASLHQLSSVLSAVSSATRSIDEGAHDIKQSADGLSHRTEQQAASLEQTAAALDQITSNVANAAKRAEEAQSTAATANLTAAQSGKVVKSAVDAMQRIETSSSQMSTIISAIDSIAFQTNLLALNAGVEAARAGEAGKGFAVVAQEVRELAQRSAAAAKEISQLIKVSTDEITEGVILVRAAGSALKAIESYIETVNAHINAIALSTKEQSLGLSEVNAAVNQMDSVTQKNAAMVEENNAAINALAVESNALQDLLARFRLETRTTLTRQAA